MNILTSALGHYEVIGNPAEADCVIGHAYGTSVHELSVNRALVDFMLLHASGRPIIADQTLTNTFPEEEGVTFNTKTAIATTLGNGDGTWGTLVQAQKYMERNDLSKPIMVAQAHHIGRVAMQGNKLGIDSVVLPGLPHQFVPDSEQAFTRNLGLWIPRELIGSVVLRFQHKL